MKKHITSKETGGLFKFTEAKEVYEMIHYGKILDYFL